MPNIENNNEPAFLHRGTGGLIPHIEALIFASDKPLTVIEITDLINQAFGFMEDKIEVAQINIALEGIVEKYNSEFYPFEVKESGGGWQFLTKKDFHKTVAQLNGEKFLKRLSAAALETLAIVAYKQPVTKGEIESIRGVSTDYAMQKLLEKELVVITGRNEKLPGHPLVYATSKTFMDYFGINSPEDLPKIKEVLAGQLIEPTIVNHTNFEQSETLNAAEEEELMQTGINAGEQIETKAGEQFLEEVTAEEAIEEYITDEVFIESDEMEVEEALGNPVPEKSLSPDIDETPDDEASGDTNFEEKENKQ